ncbi:hypothetical protein Hanom_Chr12g01139711 [Helianthus anomalus]
MPPPSLLLTPAGLPPSTIISTVAATVCGGAAAAEQSRHRHSLSPRLSLSSIRISLPLYHRRRMWRLPLSFPTSE